MGVRFGRKDAKCFLLKPAVSPHPLPGIMSDDESVNGDESDMENEHEVDGVWLGPDAYEGDSEEDWQEMRRPPRRRGTQHSPQLPSHLHWVLRPLLRPCVCCSVRCSVCVADESRTHKVSQASS